MMRHLSILMLMMVASRALQARDIEIPNENLRITVPDDWKELPLVNSQRSLEIEMPNHAGAIFLDVIPNPKGERVDDPAVVADYKRGMMDNPRLSGIKVTCLSIGPLTLDNLPAYQYEVEFEKPGQAPFYFHGYNIAVNGKGYAFSLRAPKAETDLRPMEKVMETIHFSGPRVVPEAKPVAPTAAGK